MSRVVPKLRFPEFRGDEGWEEKAVGELTDSFSGGTPISNEKAFYGGNIPFIRSAEIDGESTELFITEAGLVNSSAKLVKKGDVLVALYGANSGDVAIAKIDGAINQAILCLRSEESNDFLVNILELNKELIISKYVQGGQGNLSGEIVKSLRFFFPGEDEQSKIAACLSSLDDLVAAHQKKLEALKRHKRGLMQRLFPAEGETLPQLRFPEFRRAGEWADIRLSEAVTKIGSGITPRGGEATYTRSGYPFVRSQNVGWGHLILDDIAHIDSETHSTFLGTELRLGDLLLNITGASIGRCALVDPLVEGGNVNQHVCIIRTKPERLVPAFLLQFLLSSLGQKQIDGFQAGGNRQGLNFAQVGEIGVPTPTEEEQVRIASLLNTIDSQINKQTLVLDTLGRHKKGMMQQLFPSKRGD